MVIGCQIAVTRSLALRLIHLQLGEFGNVYEGGRVLGNAANTLHLLDITVLAALPYSLYQLPKRYGIRPIESERLNPKNELTPTVNNFVGPNED